MFKQYYTIFKGFCIGIRLSWICQHF